VKQQYLNIVFVVNIIFNQADQLKSNVVSITKFAFAIQHQLAELSKDAFYEYKLRIGKSDV